MNFSAEKERKRDMGENMNKFCKILFPEDEQSQDEYEKKIEEAVQRVSRLAEHGQSGQIEDEVEAILDKVQNLAFMDGYQYAMAVLKEGLINMKS